MVIYHASITYTRRQLGHDFVFKCWRAFSKYTPLIPPLPLAAGKMRAWTKHCGLVQIMLSCDPEEVPGKMFAAPRFGVELHCTVSDFQSMDTRAAFSLMNRDSIEKGKTSS